MARAMVLLCSLLLLLGTTHGMGVNWGTQAAQNVDPSIVVQMLKDNNIKKVKLFDSDHWTVKFFAGSGIEVMLGIPNNQLRDLGDQDTAEDWVKQNVSKHIYDGGVDIKYVAVGNEPFLKAYNGSNLKTLLPAMENIQKALNKAGHTNIKVTTPQNADVYESGSGVPSDGNFRSDIRDLMSKIVEFLGDNNSMFLVNIYPFLSLYQNPDFPVEFAFFDGGAKPVQDKDISYNNMFDANLDTLYWSLKKAGHSKLKIAVGEIGWPTDGTKDANAKMAKKFYDGFFRKMASNKGTPLYPGYIEVYLFSLMDENLKSVAPGPFERHWGIFGYDGKAKYSIDFTGKGNDKMPVAAKNVQYLEQQWCVLDTEKVKNPKDVQSDIQYACSMGDCTSLKDGGSCSNLDEAHKASYAFNNYFQIQNQDVEACDFKGAAKVVKHNASTNGCLFQLALQSAGNSLPIDTGMTVFAALVTLLTLF
ncbi:Glucan endo-1,3-beta-D-glucosidase [Heracleum sosnowskyi]|uniref:Glucan endo-1,3-beta-D-glucosidase n=1 Tax=Heracleum sosnowskyi TaxID=360622 RepID=A0AAD8H898_9APIA|nr:Glucan endo-1,3-beta-D-glucosidase [Heracleum sosnowskyi]